MKINSATSTGSRLRNFRRRSVITVGLMLATAIAGQLRAADIVWSGAATAPAAGTGWTNVLNWTGGVVPGSADNAIFNTAFTGSPITINKSPATTVSVGSITLGSSATTTLNVKPQSTGPALTTLALNGVGGILLSNASTSVFITIAATNTVNGNLLNLGLTASGIIYANSVNPALPPTTAGQVDLRLPIVESGGARSITKTGPGILFLRATNSYSGTTTVNEGDLEVDATGTVGNGTGTLFLSGGNLQCGLDRSGTSASQAPIPNPIVLTADAFIYNKAGNANSSRRLPLSGTLSGSTGTLKIANPSSAASGQSFIVRLLGTFTFNRPISIGETVSGAYADTFGNFSFLNLCNSNGVQTFNGIISSVGGVIRDNPLDPTTVGGTSILTGNNTYSGGTVIGSGSLFANNSAGSALGSGVVTVTNFGTLAGNGSVVAATSVSLNGTISPGATNSSVANLNVSDLTLGPGANYIWNITAATGTAGVNWDLITCSTGWTDAGNSGNAITIKVDSLGAAPTGWNSLTARDWVIIQSSSATGFDVSHFALDTTAFSGTIGGVFSLSVSGNSLHLIYTPAADTVINVPSGSVTQGGTSPTPYPNINVAGGIVKVGNGEVILTNAANSYPGSTKIYAGTASLAVDALNGSGAFGAASDAVRLGNTTGNSNATLNINTAGMTMGRSVLVQSGSSGVKTIGTTISSGAATYSGDVTLQDNVTLSATTGSSELFSGNFTGTGGITFGGGGAITMNAVNSYSGPTTLTGGTLNLNAKALGTNTFTISAVSTLDNTSAASVTLNDCPQNWNANFNFAGTTNLNLGGGPVTMSATRTLTISNSTLTVGGTIAGSGGLLKLGAGTLVLSGPTNSTYTGGTTNSAGVLGIGGNATLGDGTGTLLLNGGYILSTSSRASLPVVNPVLMTTDTTIYGNSTATAPSTRVLPFSGNWTVAGTMRIGNTGLANNTFEARLTAGNDVTWPVIVGDPAFDTAGAISELALYQSNTNPVQIVSGLITGNGLVLRGSVTAGAGGTTIFTGNNTYAGGTTLDSGTIGIGLDSTPTSGTLTSGPLGTGTFEIDNDPAIYIFASGAARTIGNRIFLNGVANTVFNGTNALTLTGVVNLGSSTKTLTVSNTAPVTFSGQLTNNAAITTAGPGKLIFSGDNSARTNATTVNSGTLLVNNTVGSGTGSGGVTVNSGGTLGGTGSIGGPVTVSSGGTIAAGASIGTLTINSDLTLSGNVAVEVNTSANPSNDLIIVSGVVSNAATASVTVNNLGPALTVGKKFTIFSSPVANGAAMTVSGGGMNWTNNLAVDGSISALSVASSVNTNTFAINASVSGSNLNLSWPPDRLGWKVQMQTNSLSAGLNANWVTLSATASVTNYTVTINPANPTVFIRMIYP